MYRSAINYLEKWKTKTRRKPLVIHGARQVGKSYLVSMFARQNFSDFIEINFGKDPKAVSLFNGTPEKAISLLELKYTKHIDIEKNTTVDPLLSRRTDQAAGTKWIKKHTRPQIIPISQ